MYKETERGQNDGNAEVSDPIPKENETSASNGQANINEITQHVATESAESKLHAKRRPYPVARATIDLDTIEKTESESKKILERRRLSRSKSVVNVLKIHSPNSSIAGGVEDENIQGLLQRGNSEHSLAGQVEGNTIAQNGGNVTRQHKLAKSYLSDSHVSRENGDAIGSEQLLPPNHPFMKRYQAAIKGHLVQQREQIRVDLKQNEDFMKLKRTNYEKTAGEFYGMKQELDKLNRAIAQASENVEKMTTERMALEDSARPAWTQVKDARARIDELGKAEKMARDELRRLNAQISEMLNETAFTNHMTVAKNAIKKAQQDLSIAEAEKTRQETLTARLVDVVASKDEELSTIETELKTALTEIEENREKLLILNAETQTVSIEKRNLLQRWQATLKGMKRRDDEIAEIQNMLRNHQRSASSFESEVSSLVKTYNMVREANDRLIETVTRLQDEIERSVSSIGEIQSKEGAIEAEISVFEQEIDDLGMQKNSLRKERTSLGNTLSTLLAKLSYERNEIVKLEDAMMGIASGPGGDRLVTQSIKELEKLKRASAEAENSCSEVELELEKESLLWEEMDSSTKALKKSYQDYKALTDEAQMVVKKLQEELQHHVVTIDKKLTQIQLLQQKLNTGRKMADSNELAADSTMTQLRSELDTLQKDANACDDRLVKLQKEWMKFQEQLIAVSEALEKENGTISALLNAQLDLEQRNVRLQGEMGLTREEETQTRKEMDKVHLQMPKLNEAITRKLGAKVTLESDNFGHMANQIKETEMACVEMEEKLARKMSEKANLENTLKDAQAQIGIWERKTTEMKTMRESMMHQNNEDMNGMVADVRRIQMRLGQLAKMREITVKEMEKAVSKRDVLLQKGEAVSAAKTIQLTQAQLSRAVVEMRRKVKQLQKDLETAEREQDENRMSLEKSTAAVQENGDVEIEVTRKRERQCEELKELAATHFKNSHILAVQQLRHKRLEDAREGRYQPVCRDGDQLENRRREEEKKRELLLQLVSTIQTTHPELNDNLKKIETLLKV